ncbi:PREDICTED: PHD finger protein rhinoceros [Dinoponera quadriceps]|uniref:PHD finger protein rhinoceros n=1 Tax=Dinoponera quadriceps TaxID=609295 RepID=A0A6P3Y1P7_DINQU|nr:PREDICTED: PHD finger protein rhinoceros [Dinoponera quadriceps]
MAQRGKRVHRNDNDLASYPGAIKRRKCRLGPAATGSSSLAATMGPSEEEETMASSSQVGASWTPRPVSDIKISSIYNRSAAEAPAELFRKDLISAMKLPDSEPLSPNEYWVITDQWKQEWERGVQVPVNPDSLPEPMVTVMQTSPLKLHTEFKLPKKFIRITRDDYFNSEDHHLSTTPARAEKACAYDLDDADIAWLDIFNGERAQAGQLPITESQLERVMEELEVRCWERIQTIVKNEEGLGIEYDENVICDVCRSPDSEEGNEMVFCDCCNICVHQACYGITSIPDGSWLCRTCSLSQRPDCVLCPNKGGAMKCTRSGQKWAHVSCALWIPEVSIGCVERMEPITKISSIPQSRWALICVLCRERVGACIQCSIKTCKTAYHVTCAFKYGLEMKAIIEDEMADDGVKLRSYCQKHSRTNTKDKVGVGGSVGSGGGKGGSDSEDGESRRRKRKDMTSEEKNQARAAKLQEIEAEFDKHVSIKDITSQQLDIDPDSIVYIYNYWKLKRRAGHNKPLLAPRCGELSSAGARAQGQAADMEKMRTFVQLRQDLERVRNLCYMVGRREKLCRSFLRLREQTFHKQALLLAGPPLPPAAAAAVVEANHGPSIYDRLYSHPDSEDHTHDFETIVARIAGVKSPTPVSSDEKKVQLDFNGASNKKLYFNGSVRRKSLYGSDLSISSSETEVTKPTKTAAGKCASKSKQPAGVKAELESSTEEEADASKSKTPARRKSKKASAPDRPRPKLRDNSESDKLDTVNSRSRTLQHMEKELGSASGSESDDEFLPLSTNAASRLGPSVASAIYSDTDSDSVEHHSSHSAVLITKAAVKEFSAAEISKNATSQKNFANKDRQEYHHADEPKSKENAKGSKKKEYIPSALIVPQRQAAKKASEIMQRAQGKKENTVNEPVEFVKSPGEEQPVKPAKPSSAKEKPSSKKQRDSKPAKDTKNNDVYDFDKDFGDGTEILAYVPQRQAAKKAAEHIKSGMGTKTAPPDLETAEVKGTKKELPDGGKRKDAKKEESPKKEELPRKDEPPTKERKGNKKPVAAESSKSASSALTSNSESSSSSSCSSSSESSSDSDVAKSPLQKSANKEPTSSSTTTTSSESDTGNQVKSSNRTLNKRQVNKVVHDDNEAEKSLAGRKLKKLPDKKLKTSDGRHGPEFQPPLTEREESGRAIVPKESQQQQQHHHHHHPQQQQPSLGKKADQRDSKKSVQSSQQQQQQHQQTGQGVLAGSRDNDGLRSVPGPKSTKKSGQPVRQTQQSASRSKEDAGSRAKSETRKRKSSETAAKDEKVVKESLPLKKVEKKLSERSSRETEKESKHDISGKNAPEATAEPTKTSENSTAGVAKADDKKTKKTSHRNAINTLEEEMKQRRAERDAPKKPSRGLDKLLEKREHLDKLSRNRTAAGQEVKLEKTSFVEENNDKDVLPEKPVAKETFKVEDDVKNHMSEQAEVLNTTKVEKEEESEKDIVEVVPDKPERRKKVEQKPESVGEAQAVETVAVGGPVDVGKEAGDNNVCSKSAPEKAPVLTVDVVPEKECQKRRKSVNRSIFSPQHHGGKDPSVSELFDFDHDVLTDDMVIDDGISIPRDEERAAPLTFSFNNELWFKEDSKEDSARETLHLVEKLRMELSKKSNSSQFELESVPAEEEPRKEEAQPEKPVLEQPQQLILPEKAEVPEQPVEQQPPPAVLEMKNDEPMQVEPEDDELVKCKSHGAMEEKRKPCYSSNNSEHYMYGNEERETTAKVTVVERAKLEMDADADERWVPPSLPPCPPENYNLGALMDNQNHRYAGHPQFPNDIGAVMPDTGNPDLVHLQLNINMQEQYLQLQQTHSMERVQSHLEQQQHAEQSRVQSLAMMDQQVIPAQMSVEDSLTPMEMVNRHLIGLPNSEDDQGSEMDRVLDKDEISPDIRQDYTQGGSPYNELNGARPDTRWAESQVLPSRRSTSSSITSASSAEEHAAMPPYKGVPPIPYPPCTMDAAPYHYSETSSYGAGAVSLFPPQSCNAPLPYPSPGTAMFPPPFGAAFPTPQSLLPHVPKPLEESLNMQASPCTAAFTSSSHNMALTAAMVSPTKVTTPPPQPPLPQPAVQQPPTPVPPQLQPSEALPQQVNSPTVPASFLNAIPETRVSETAAAESVPEVLTDSKSAPCGKKSPAKPTRTSARVTSLQGKSPGKSPRQETGKSVPSARGRGRGAKGSQQSSYRGRGRGRGRRGRGSQSAMPMPAMVANALHNDDSIQNKLVGTVYDFDSDEDSANETNIADLRMMRERKKSTDVNEKRVEPLGLANDAVHQSHLSSPGGLHKKYGDDKKLSSPATHDPAGLGKSETSAGQAFADTVMPLLPGPVDMRTYNSTVDQPSSSVHGQSYGNHLLGSFAAGVSADPNLQDMEDFESELHSVLKKASTGKQQLVASDGLEAGCVKPGYADPSAIDPAAASSFNDTTNKVSLTDSRNQLKVKIKGPFLDANYVPASSVPPLAQQAPVIITPTANTAAVASGTSNLRRMRKKELLRQYCSQDMNMDDPARENVTSAPINMQPINHGQRTVITIPKAVASMTSIPTREDYKAVVDANMEKKRRKERGGGGSAGNAASVAVGATAGGGFLDVTAEEEAGSERRRSIMVSTVDRRRGRQARPTATAVTNSAHPKLKIKIGNSIIGGQEVGNAQDDCSRIRPPKKRLSSIPITAPSMEELRRESMKFRKMIMAGFDNDEKTKARSKRDKNGKRKKRQYSKKEARVQILEGDAPKLIIRLGKPGANSTSSSAAAASASVDAATSDVSAILLAAGDENANQQGSTDNKDSRVGPPPPEPSKEEVVYPVEGGLDEKQPTEPNAGATALRNVRSAKVTPIRLKLTRCLEGYELKDPVASSASVDDASRGGSNNSSATTTATVVNSVAPLPVQEVW